MKLLRTERTIPVQGGATRLRSRRGQSTIELALVLPLLVVLLSIVIEAGLALNAWVRVNTASRDAARFALDGGRPDDTESLVLNKLPGVDPNLLTIYMVRGKTDSTGTIVAWNVDRHHGTGLLHVQRSEIQQRLAVSGNPSKSVNIVFTIVEVDYNYPPLMATLVARGSYIPISTYAIIQQY